MPAVVVRTPLIVPAHAPESSFDPKFTTTADQRRRAQHANARQSSVDGIPALSAPADKSAYLMFPILTYDKYFVPNFVHWLRDMPSYL